LGSIQVRRHDDHKTKSHHVDSSKLGGCVKLFQIWNGSNTKGTSWRAPSPIDTIFKAFNSKDSALLYSVYAGNLVVIDGFAPYRWIGPDAVAEWWTDAETWAKDLGVEKEDLAFSGIRAWGLVGNRAYASISATLTITLKKGDPIVRPGILH
jgi:ketosteroid isomerase-like protein